MAKKQPKFTSQALNASIVRYGPELSALTALLKQAEEDRDLRFRQAKSGRQYGVGAVDAAVPQIRSAYSGATKAIAPAFTAQGGLESGALGARMGEAQALAQSQLAARRVSAIEGEGAARTAAQRDYRSDFGKIGSRFADVKREMGAYASETIADLTAAEAKALADAQSQQASLNQQERNSKRSAGIDPDTGLPIPGGKLDPNAPSNKPKPGKSPWASQERQAAASDEIGRLLKEAKENKAAGESRADAADLLLTGVPKGQRPVYQTDSSGKQVRVLNPDGTQKTVDDPGFDAAKSQLLAAAALDMAYDGHLSRRTQRLLHQRGIQLKPLGLVTFGEWLKTPEGQEWKRKQRGGGTITRPGNAPSGPGSSQSRPT